jgi:cytoskeletal protein CcmA (bactofilin family)
MREKRKTELFSYIHYGIPDLNLHLLCFNEGQLALIDRVIDTDYNRKNLRDVKERMSQNENKDNLDFEDLKADPSPASSIGPQCEIKGNIKGSENLIVAGNIQGKIDLGDFDLTVEETARIHADIRAKNIILLGKVTGNITASGKVLIHNTANMTGDITTPRISVMDGARFKGSVFMKKESASNLKTES